MSITIDRELSLSDFYTQTIVPFWQNTVIEEQFEGQLNASIKYCYALCSDAIGTIIISPGRVEGYIKYQELMFDLYQQNYNVFIIDHRGQGFSTRLLSNQDKGYVESFEEYIADFSHFVEHIVHAITPTRVPAVKTFILGHSMGSAIATLYLQQSTTAISAAALVAPMYGFNTGGIPNIVAETLVSIWVNLGKWLKQEPWYFLGQANYEAKAFSNNHLTYSKARYDHFKAVYEHFPKAKLGGVTAHWLSVSNAAIKKIYHQAQQLVTPSLILQASDDTIVDNKAQNKFVEKNNLAHSGNTVTLLNIQSARHEILIEKDTVRNQALSEILDFFANHR